MCSLTLASCAPQMPQTRKDPTTDEYFGTMVPDPYRWLEDDLSPETAAWVEVQKIYYHKIGTPQSEDELFYSNPDEPLRFYGVSINEDETKAFLSKDGADVGNNLYVKELKRGGGKPMAKVLEEQADIYSFIMYNLKMSY